MTTDPGLPSDDELAQIMFREWNTFEDASGQDTMKHVLQTIRPHLEARGIELAAERALEYGEEPGVANELRALARQRAGQGDGE